MKEKIKTLFADIISAPGSLRRRTFLLLLGISLGSILVVNLIWLPGNIKEIQQAQAELRQVSVQLVRDQVQGYLGSKEADLLITARRFRSALFEGSLGQDELRLTAQRLLQSEPAVEEVGILDEKGKEILRLSRRSAISDRDLADRSTSSLFREGIKQEVYWEPVKINETSEPLGVLSVRLPDSDPFLKGLVFGVINLRPLWKLTGEFKLSQQGRVYIVDEKGILIAAANPSEVLRQLSFADRHFIRQLIAPGSSHHSSFVAGDYINERGVPTIATGLLLSRPRWGIVIEQPQSVLFTPIRQKIWFVAGLSLLGLLLSFGLAQMLSRRLTEPIVRLQDGAQQVGGGNLAYRVPVTTDDEIGALARQFNFMAGQLQASQEATLSALTIPVMSHTGEMHDILSEVITKVVSVTGADAASFRLTDDENKEFVFSVYQGFSEAYQNDWSRLIRDGSRRKRILTTGEPFFSGDILNDSADFGTLLPREGFRSLAYLPLKTPQKIFGLITLVSREPGRFSAKNADITLAIAHQISVALQNIMLFQETMASHEDLEKLNAVLTQQAAELASANTAMAREVTERKLAEEERQKMEERLHRAEKMEALGQLAGGVAHDLNNVLGVLSGYSELLVERLSEGNPLREYATNIFKSSAKGATIIQDLLTLARRGVVVAQVVELNSVIANLMAAPEFNRLKDYHSRVNFKADLAKDLLHIKGSPVHLEKMLLNLLSNAAEAIAGDGEVQIRTENRYLDHAVRGYDKVEEGDYMVLTVSDTGTGIAAEDLNKIFEPFYTKKKMGRSGTGLGLAIVWGTVKDHEGYIDVQGIEGQGTTFTLYFPVTREKAAENVQKIPLEQYLGRGESILVVDDVPEQRQVASTLLMRLGYQVKAVSSGEEAVEYLQSNKADLLVLDMIMEPGIDGLETYKRVVATNPRQKAIIVSGFSETERVREAQNLGAGMYVKKPYVLEKIGVAIRDELNRLPAE